MIRTYFYIFKHGEKLSHLNSPLLQNWIFYFWLELPKGHIWDLLGRLEKLIPKDPSKSEYHLPGIRFHQNRRHTTFSARWRAVNPLWYDSNFIHCCFGKCSKVQTPWNLTLCVTLDLYFAVWVITASYFSLRQGCDTEKPYGQTALTYSSIHFSFSFLSFLPPLESISSLIF